jgi:phosphoenolpyruvate-protein kinase (PTS system EI component)
LPLREYLQKSYVDLFVLAPKLVFTDQQIEEQRESFHKGRDMCVTRFKDHAKQYGKQIDTAQKNLKENTAKLNDADRQQIHCQIQNLDLLKSEADALSGMAIPTAYDNLNAKLDVIEKWPALYKQTQQQIADESYMKRRWSDVKDIGFREIAANQQDDIKRGQDALEELKRTGLLPPAVEDKKIQDYVNTVAQRVARYRDRAGRERGRGGHGR